jgi:hypothetical protein
VTASRDKPERAATLPKQASVRRPHGRFVRRRMPGLATALAAGALALTGCGGGGAAGKASSDNGIAAKSPREVLSATQKAVQDAESVHVNSSSSQGPLKVSLNMDMTTAGSGGTIDLLGFKAELVRSGNTLYIKGDSTLYKQLGIKQSVPADTWVAVPAAHASQLTAILDLKSEVTRLLATNAAITKGKTTRVNGEPALELHAAGKLYNGTLYVKTTGQPYPIKLEKQGQEDGETEFSGWNTTSAPPAPAKAISFG